MQTTTLVSHEKYFDLLAKSEVKLEYHSGEIIAMVGAQPAHNRICITSDENVLIGDCLISLKNIYNKVELPEINSIGF